MDGISIDDQNGWTIVSLGRGPNGEWYVHNCCDGGEVSVQKIYDLRDWLNDQLAKQADA